MASIRIGRVQELLTREISRVLRTRIKDSRIGFLTVTGVDISPDLENARVYVSVIGTDKEKRDSMAGLNAATPFIRKEVGHAIKLRKVPKMTFAYDEAPERGEHMYAILKELENGAEKHPAGN
ncbi:MAG: 30S ribosome-binding factor RbfA [Fibrobacterota bacterium]